MTKLLSSSYTNQKGSPHVHKTLDIMFQSENVIGHYELTIVDMEQVLTCAVSTEIAIYRLH